MKAQVTRHGQFRLGATASCFVALALFASPAMADKFTIKNCGTTEISVHTSAPESGKKHEKPLAGGETTQITCANATCNLTFKAEGACPSDKTATNRAPDSYVVQYGYTRDDSGNCRGGWDLARGDECVLLPNP